VTLKEWKEKLQVGTRLRCVYRHYNPEANEVVRIVKVQKNSVAWVYEDGQGTLNLKPGQVAWMYFPKASALIHTERGFELHFPEGRLMSIYEWA
jgi:hypothetical protein